MQSLSRVALNVLLLVFSTVMGRDASAQTSDYHGMVDFETHCATCHTISTTDTRIPTRDELKRLPPTKILEVITTGKMAANAQGLTDAQKRRLAEWVTGRPVTAIDRSAAGMSNACAPGMKLRDPFSGPRWIGWSPDVTTNSRFQTAEAAGLDAKQIPRLRLKWAFGLPGASTLRSQPTVGGGWLWVGSDNSMVYALDAITGCVHWSFEAERPVMSTVSIGRMEGVPGRYVAYFGDHGANVYAVDAETGKQLWRIRVEDHPSAVVSGSVALDAAHGRLIVPIGSWEEVLGLSPTYACCTSRGGVMALDAKTGKPVWKTYTLQETARPVWKTESGVQHFGPAGAGVWVTPTIDVKRNAVYVGTSNAYIAVPDGGASDSIFAFDLTSGQVLWSRQLLSDDANLFSCGATAEEQRKYCPGRGEGPNDDISAAPLLHTLADGRQIIIASQESRRITVLDPDRKGAIIWQGIPSDRHTALSGNLGPASDGQLLYVPLAYEKQHTSGKLSLFEADGGLVALYPETGRRAWTVTIPAPDGCPDPQSRWCKSANQAAVTAIPGAVFAGSIDGTLRAYSTRDGSVLWSYATNRSFETTNGIKAHGGSIGGPGPTIAGGMVYWGSGYTILGTMPGNVLLAFEIR